MNARESVSNIVQCLSDESCDILACVNPDYEAQDPDILLYLLVVATEVAKLRKVMEAK